MIPAEHVPPDAAKAVFEVEIRSARSGVKRAQLRNGECPEEGEQSSGDPYDKNEPHRVQMTRDDGRNNEDPRADDRTHVDREPFLESKGAKELRFV